jgi:hypothetical protein
VWAGKEVLSAQLGCITFHSNWYKDQVKLTPAVKNKWSTGWMKAWFYCKVPIHQSALGGKSVHVLHSYMTDLEYVMEPPHDCPDSDPNDKAFIRATTTIGGRDAVEEFMSSKIWPLSAGLDFNKILEALTPISKVILPWLKFVVVKPDGECDEQFVMKGY